MARHTDPVGIHHAQLAGAASGLRGLIRGDVVRYELLRASWPDLAERLDRIIELVDWG